MEGLKWERHTGKAMENLIILLFPIFILFVAIGFALKFVFGNAAVDHAKGMILYDLIRVVVALPFKIIGFVFKRVF